MDVSQEYIKMRLEAIEFLGKGIVPKATDNLYYYYDEYSVLVDPKGTFFVQDNAHTNEYLCVLERQDQLQEILGGIWYEQIQELDEFRKEYTEYLQSCSSFEQLWLLFVMKENFSKEWVYDKWQ